MTAAPRLFVEEYLQNPTKPESEYINGELFQKARASEKHSELQAALILLLNKFRVAALSKVLPELSVRLSKEVILIPDLV